MGFWKKLTKTILTIGYVIYWYAVFKLWSVLMSSSTLGATIGLAILALFSIGGSALITILYLMCIFS